MTSPKSKYTCIDIIVLLNIQGEGIESKEDLEKAIPSDKDNSKDTEDESANIKDASVKTDEKEHSENTIEVKKMRKLTSHLNHVSPGFGIEFLVVEHLR